MIYVQIGEYYWEILPTVFPDNTCQMWGIDEDVVVEIEEATEITIIWDTRINNNVFVDGTEMMAFAQIAKLIKSINTSSIITAYIPYFPYARQDKTVSNHTTFGLHCFVDFLNSCDIDTVWTLDVHCNTKLLDNLLAVPYYNEEPDYTDVIEDSETTAICFPDSGAERRYSHLVDELTDHHPIVAEKVRDQETGEITGMALVQYPDNDEFDTIVIIDDICDGGRTFVSCAQLLKKQYPNKKIVLCVSHGIFSKGREVLIEAGIDEIITLYTG